MNININSIKSENAFVFLLNMLLFGETNIEEFEQAAFAGESTDGFQEDRTWSHAAESV